MGKQQDLLGKLASTFAALAQTGQGDGCGKGGNKSRRGDQRANQSNQHNKEKLIGGKTPRQIDALLHKGVGWDGGHQFVWWRGAYYHGKFQKGDLTCGNCGFATNRHFRDQCFVCRSPLASGAGGTSGRAAATGEMPRVGAKPAAQHDSPGPTWAQRLVGADDLPSLRTKPPNTLGAALAAASVASLPAEEAGCEPHAPTDGDTAMADDDGKATEVISSVAVASLKQLLSEAALPKELHGLIATTLGRHSKAATEKEASDYAAQVDTLDVTGKNCEQVVAIRRQRAAALERERADLTAKLATEADEREKKTTSDRKVLTDQVQKAKELLDEFEKRTRTQNAAWEAASQTRLDKATTRRDAANAALAKAEEALKNAPSPTAPYHVTQEGTDAMDTSETMADASATTHTTPNAGTIATSAQRILPYCPPPALTPPTDATSLEKLTKVKAMVQLWWVQEVDLPLTAEELGLTLEEIASLVGSDNWVAGAFTSSHAPLSRRIIGLLSTALAALEIGVAVQQAATPALERRVRPRTEAPEEDDV